MFHLTETTSTSIPFGSIAGIIGTFTIALAVCILLSTPNLHLPLLTNIFFTCQFIVLFSIYYVRKYTNPNETDRGTTITAVSSLIVALLTCSILPIDIFIVSTMKNADGSFKEWSLNETTRNYYENQVLYSYYCEYSTCCANWND